MIRPCAVLLCALSTLMFASGQHVGSTESGSTRNRTFTPRDAERILTGSCELMSSTSRFPDSLKSAFAESTKQEKFALANPGDRYQETDVIKGRELPSRRLVVGGRCQEFWFIHYEQGGIGHSYAVVFFQGDSNGRLSLVWGGRGFTRADTVADLRNEIAKKLFSDDLPFYW